VNLETVIIVGSCRCNRRPHRIINNAQAFVNEGIEAPELSLQRRFVARKQQPNRGAGREVPAAQIRRVSRILRIAAVMLVFPAVTSNRLGFTKAGRNANRNGGRARTHKERQEKHQTHHPRSMSAFEGKRIASIVKPDDIS
jgi:hypothetical protein